MAVKTKGNTLYFVSDMHFGIPSWEDSLEREKMFVSFLDEIKQDATDIFILGDMFDFWFEWKYVAPKGYVRLLGRLAELSDRGIRLYYFSGNHDIWLFGYLEKEIGMNIYHNPEFFECNNEIFYLAHGDGLGPGDIGYKIMKKIFRSKISQWIYARLHPNFATALANFLSNKSRYANLKKDIWESIFAKQVIYAESILSNHKVDYFIFAHQHIPMKKQIGNAELYNIGNWMGDFSYIRYGESELKQGNYSADVLTTKEINIL